LLTTNVPSLFARSIQYMDFNGNTVIMTKNTRGVNCNSVVFTELPCPLFAGISVNFIYMTHLQELFIGNLRFFRQKRGISQLKFSEMINLSPNYLNAIEKGKNFPSPEVIQQIADTLKVLPYQLFLEHPVEISQAPVNMLIPEMMRIKQQFIKDIEELIKKCEENTTLQT